MAPQDVWVLCDRKPCMLDVEVPACGGLLSMQVKGQSDINICLTDSDVLREEPRLVSAADQFPCYLLRIANYMNLKTCIDTRDGDGNVACIRHPPLLQQDTYIDLWMNLEQSADQTVITIGTAYPSSANILLQWTDPTPRHTVTRIGLSTWNSKVFIRNISFSPEPIPDVELYVPHLTGVLKESGSLEFLRTSQQRCVVRFASGEVLDCPVMLLAGCSRYFKEALSALDREGKEMEVDLPADVTPRDFKDWLEAMLRSRHPARSPASSLLQFERPTGYVVEDSIEGFLSMAKEGLFTDFKINIHTDDGVVEAPCHSEVLDQLVFFEKLMRSECHEGLAKAVSLDLRPFSRGQCGVGTTDLLMRILYTEALSDRDEVLVDAGSEEEILTLIPMLHMLELKRSLVACCKLLKLEGKTREELLKLAQVAEIYSLQLLGMRVLDEVLSRKSFFLTSEDLFPAPAPLAVQVLKSDTALAHLTEDDILTMALAYIEHHQLHRKCKGSHLAHAILQSVRFRFVTPQAGNHLRESMACPRLEAMLQHMPSHETAGEILVKPGLRTIEVAQCTVAMHPRKKGTAGVIGQLSSSGNPCKLAKLKVITSSPKDPSSAGWRLFGNPRSITAFPTSSEPFPWITIDFLDRRLFLSAYELQHDTSDTDFLRSWELQAADGDGDWVTLDARVQDGSLTHPRHTVRFGIPPQKKAFSRFRVTAYETNRSRQLTLGRIELYGTWDETTTA